MHSSRAIYNTTFNKMNIQTDTTAQYGCYGDMLNKLQELFQYTTAKHCKVFFVRFDVNFPQDREYPQDNSIFERFIANFVKNLKRHSLDPHYLWVREATYQHSPNHHYHCVLWLDGNKTQSIHGHLAKAEELWNRALNLPQGSCGLINYCTRDRYGNPQENGIMLRRNSSDFEGQYRRCFHWASYLAKVATKGNVARNVREFGCSQLPRIR